MIALVIPVLCVFIYGFLFVGLYSSIGHNLLVNWNGGDYSYAWLIPFVIGWLIWENRNVLRAAAEEKVWWGIVPVILGIGCFWLGQLGGEYFTLYVSAWLTLTGILQLHLGVQKMKIAIFPLFLILTAFPLPEFLYSRVSLSLQLISSRFGADWLQLIGIVAHREGNVIDIGFTRLQVVEACSGLRYVFPLLFLSLIIVYFFRASIWKRVFLVLSTIPLTIFWNSLRIALTGYFWITFGPKAAEGFLHALSGVVIFLVSLGLLLGEVWVLGRIGRGPAQKSSGGGSGGGGAPRESSRTAETFPTPFRIHENGQPAPSFGLHWRRHILRDLTVFLLLGATLICFNRINFRENIPIREPLSHFPLQIGKWRGAREPMDPETLRFLQLSDYSIIDYRNKAGQNINLYIAYLEKQIKGYSIHSPETCLPANGWVFDKTSTVRLPVKYCGNFLAVDRVIMTKLDDRMLAYFWFPQRGRILTNIFQLKLYNFWDALTLHRTDGAVVRILTPIGNAESAHDAELRLDRFLGHVVPMLDSFLPGRRSPSGSGRISAINASAPQ